MSYDEQPDGDPHGECAAEIHKLQDVVRRLLSCNIEENRNIPGSAGAIRFAREALRADPTPAPLPLMRAAFRTSVSDGLASRYELRFKFGSLADMHKADAEWRAFTTQFPEESRNAG